LKELVNYFCLIFDSGIAEMEKMLSNGNIPMDIKPNSASTTQNPSSTQKANEKKDSNPFAEAFKDMSNSFKIPGGDDQFLNMFKDMKNFDKEGLKSINNLYDVLEKLSHTAEQKDINSKMSKEELYPLFESLFDILMLQDMTTPLKQIKTSVNNHLNTNSSKITEEQRVKYNSVTTCIDTILIELKRAQPDKKLIISSFQQLHELSDFGADIFPEGQNFNLMDGLMGAGMNMSGQSKGSDVKDIADKFFNKK